VLHAARDALQHAVAHPLLGRGQPPRITSSAPEIASIFSCSATRLIFLDPAEVSQPISNVVYFAACGLTNLDEQFDERCTTLRLRSRPRRVPAAF
jgi:hypothetical protein